MKKNVIPLIFAVSLSAGISSMTAMAGNINENEASVIQVASGTFDYGGKTYVAKSEYLNQLTAKLSEDGVDLTEQQALEVISQIYANVATGVQQGYIQEIGGGVSEDQTEAQVDKEKATVKSKKLSDSNQDANDPKQTDYGENQEDPSGNQELADSQRGEAGQEREAVGIGDVIDSDPEAGNYEGYDISKIYEKDAKHRTKDEQQVYEKYLSEKAVESLNIGESGTRQAETAAISESESKVSRILGEYGAAAGLALLAVLLAVFLIAMIVRIRKASAGKRSLPEFFTDIHTHVLPEADDGAADEEMFMRMVEESYRQGVRQMIATPHYRSSHHHKRAEDLQELYERMKARAEKEFPGFVLYLGNELYYSDGIMQKLKEKRALTLAETKYVLIEFRKDDPYSRIERAVIELLRDCYIPVIAHVERYPSLLSCRRHIEALRGMGALIQMNADSAGKCKKLLKKGCIDFIATDCHDLKQRGPRLLQGIYKICAYCSPEQIQEILVKNPKKILDRK